MHPPIGRPWIIAHRGASHRHPENTLIAFRAAADLGADAVELDVRRTAEGPPVVHHDPTIPGLGAIVDRSTTDLQQTAPWLPTLDHALTACAGMWVNVEIKNSPAEPDWDPDDTALRDVVGRVPPETLVSSFNPRTVHRARERRGRHRTGYLVPEGADLDRAIAAAEGHDTVHIAGADLGPGGAPEVVAHAAERGLWVIAWTVDDAATIERLATAGVAGIITNTPDVAATVLGA